jgi:undecaprenyl-diphosphatase
MTALIQQLDESVLFFIQEHFRSPLMDRLMVFVTSLGNAGFLWIFIAFLLLCQKRYQKCGIALICALSLSMLLNDEIIKPLIGRVRPFVKFTEVPLLISAGSYSFPSGHSTAAFASAAVIAHYYRTAGLLTYVLAALIAYSRLYLFVHYPSDALAGMVLGILVAYLIVKGIDLLYACHLDSGTHKAL